MTTPSSSPIKQEWLNGGCTRSSAISLTIYDRATWGFIYTPEGLSGFSSRNLDQMKLNEDGSVTLYFGPRAPEGYESNWIPTGDKIPFPMFRFYGPTEGLFDRSFTLSDVELVE